MSTTLPFERGNYRRVCDSCGALWNRSQLTKGKDNFWRCRDCANLIPSIVLDARNANSPKLKVRPVPDSKPWDTISVATDIEGRMFNMLDEVAPSRYYDVTNSTSGAVVGSQDLLGAAETIRAFYNIVVENKRETVVINRAKVRIAALADWLLTKQMGSATGWSTYASSTTAYGAFAIVLGTGALGTGTVTFYSGDVAAAGLALAQAYALTGTGAYLTGARAAALCLRRMQCGDLHSSNFTATASQGTTPLHLGMWVHSLTLTITHVDVDPPPDPFVYTYKYDHDFYHADLGGLEFLATMQTLLGDVSFGDSTAVGEFTAATSAALSTMQAEATTFWTLGVADAGAATAITGFSATTPKDYFDAFRSDIASTGTWQGSGSTAQGWGKAIRAAYNAGTTSFKALAVTIWSWLMTFGSNPAYETTATALSDIAAATTGTFNPKLCLTTTLDTAGKQNSSSLYDWACAGLMAVVQSAQDPTSLRTAKEAITPPQYRYVEPTPRGSTYDYVPLRGKSGLSLQVQFTETVASASRRVYDVVQTAMLMDVFRRTPQLYNLIDRSA